MPRYIRAYQKGGTYFFTVVIAQRRSQLLTRHIDLLGQSIRHVRRKFPFQNDAVVVLPDHIHCIWTLPPGDDDFSNRWRLIKIRFSRSIEQTEPVTGIQKQNKERGIWQRRFWEHLITSEKDFEAHMDYIHYNPVKHGIVERVSDWPYSSFHSYVKQGIYPRDWAADGNIRQLDWE